MASAAALLVLLVIAPAAYAVQYTVGDSDGWSTTGDYTAWTSGKTFTVGDTLLFVYDGTHSVDEVSQSAYSSCSSSNPLKSHNGGNTVITLSDAGTKYFLCPTAGHCSQGMKLAVTVVAANGTTPSTPSPPSGSTPSGTPPTGSTTSPPPPPSGSSGAPSVLNNNGLMLGFSVVFGIFLALMS